MALCYVCIQVLVSLNTDSFQDVLFILMLVLNTVYSSINAVAQTSFLGNIGRFPPAYIGSANDGIGLGGILPAVTSIVILGKRLLTRISIIIHPLLRFGCPALAGGRGGRGLLPADPGGPGPRPPHRHCHALLQAPRLRGRGGLVSGGLWPRVEVSVTC